MVKITTVNGNAYVDYFVDGEFVGEMRFLEGIPARIKNLFMLDGDLDKFCIRRVVVMERSAKEADGSYLYKTSFARLSPITVAGGIVPRIEWVSGSSKVFAAPSNKRFDFFFAHAMLKAADRLNMEGVTLHEPSDSMITNQNVGGDYA